MDVTGDGWKGIKVFTDLVDKHGLEAFTMVAFTCDYLSPFDKYKESDRFIRAQEEIYGSRKKFKIDDKMIALAIEKYKDLQFDVDLEQEQVFNEIKIGILENLREANRKNDYADVSKYTKELQKHNATIKDFKVSFNKAEAVARAISANGYVLSRIENDIKSRKKSKFVLHDQPVENPNKLNLTKK